MKSLLEAFERNVFEKFIFEVITMKSLLVSWKNITLLFIQEFVLVEITFFFCRTAIQMGSFSKTVNHLIMFFVVKKLTSPQNDSLTAIL